MIGLPKLTVSDLIRFWLRVNKKEENDCWLWIGGNRRYPGFYYQSQQYQAHRVMYFVFNGKDPDELSVCHTCNNTKCVNPKHFYLGTHTDNMQQMIDQDRRNQKGVLHRLSKLQESEVLEIRYLASKGIKLTVLSKKFHVNSGTIHDIVYRRTWKHI